MSLPSSPAERSHRVLVLGGGRAGAVAANVLMQKRRPADQLEVAVVNHTNVALAHGLMPQIVSSLVQPRSALISLRPLLRGARLYTHEISRIDLANRQVVLDRGEDQDELVLVFDYLVLALGSVTDVSRFPGLIEHGLQTKTIGDVIHLRNHIIDMLELASVERDPEQRRQLLTFVVAGAGFAGIEIGSQTNDFLHDALQFYPQINPAELRVVIINHSKHILPALRDSLVKRITRYMQRNGIELKLGVGLSSATGTGAVLSSGEHIPTRSIIATVGIGPNPLLATLPVQLNHDRIQCDAFCRVPGWPGVYAAGDNAAIPNSVTGESYPPTAIYAATQGRCVAENILAEIRGEPARRYRYNNLGELAFLGKRYAVAQIGRIPLDGVVASMLGRAFFLAYLPSWRERWPLLVDWLVGLLFPRNITQLQISRSDAIVPMRFEAGEVIIHQGEPGSRFYIVTDGEVEVVRRDANGHEAHVANLGPGEYFGEIALLHNVKRSATVRARTDTKVLSMARHDFGVLVKHIAVLRDTLDRSAREHAGSLPSAAADGRLPVGPVGDIRRG